MAYIIALTSGSVLTTIQDDTIDTTTSLNLVGRGVANYGQIIAQNFVHLLENSSSATAPAAPLRGQLWYNTFNDTLEVYDGSAWHNLVTADTATNQTITITGDATGSGTSSIALTLAPPAGLSAGGTHSKITYNNKGQVTGGADLTSTDITTALNGSLQLSGTVAATNLTLISGGNGVITFADGTHQSTAASFGTSYVFHGLDRNYNTNYTNGTGRPLVIAASGSAQAIGVTMNGVVSDQVVILGAPAKAISDHVSMYFIVPTGATYQVQVTGGTCTKLGWNEM